ncbi:MAG: hypothetical protein GPJ54_09260 [Candidatus Heimdallarchaeota archaeon]|nr:hypothetical protein [Candidatus Heimdallarchaeota archaeon]
MTRNNHFIFFIEEDEYEGLRKDRIFRLLRSRSRYKIKDHDYILFGLKSKEGNKSIIAEYETVSTETIGNGTKIMLEPIYNAPKHQGLKMNDLVTLTLSESLNFNKSVIKLSKKDFVFLSERLTR